MAKVKIDVTANDKASGKLKGLTKSIIGAQLVTQGLQAATRKLMAVGKEAIETFKKQEMAEARLSAAVGGNIDDFKAFASELQQITTVGDETTLELLQLANSMGVSQDNMKQAAKDAISLSKALGIEVTSAMKLAVNAQNDQFGALARYLPELRAATTEEEKRAIVQNALANGFKIATSEVETFSGKVQQLENSKGDLYESIGRVVGIIGKDFVDSMKDSVEGMNEFISDADRMATSMGNISAAGELFTVYLEELSSNYGDLFAGIFESLSFINDAADNTENLSTAFMLLQFAIDSTRFGVDSLILGFQVTVEAIRATIAVVSEAAGGFQKFFKALSERKFDGIKDAIQETQDGIVSILTESTKTQVTLIKDFAREQAKQAADTEKNAQALQDRILGSRKRVIEETKKQLASLTDVQTSGAEEAGDANEKAAKKSENDWGKAAQAIAKRHGQRFQFCFISSTIILREPGDRCRKLIDRPD
jgi:hypothetical protein